MKTEHLNKLFALQERNNTLQVRAGEGGIPVIDIRNRFACARISLQGAHVLSWKPEGREDVIWLSEDAEFAIGKSIRGGIPICWPWFGAHETNKDFPAHGFVRTTKWQISSTEALQDGSTRIHFTTTAQPENRMMWPADTTVRYQITIGKEMELVLVTTNDGARTITIGQALHTYFHVGDISQIFLHGLDATEYLDKPDNFNRKTQRGALTIDDEVDRIYLDTAGDCVLEDRSLDRKIIISKSGSHSTVVWNPWKTVAEKMGDLGRDGYRKMLCVESCNAADDVVTLEAGGEHRLRVQYEVQAL
ncbi:MAG TPA: D-hexose-6-phosphate mutarotase [Gammaproteobacteria bacterium]|nr:D-hexose-6-phosphate mutarotase [Gammaproteobacteria bacterium]